MHVARRVILPFRNLLPGVAIGLLLAVGVTALVPGAGAAVPVTSNIALVGDGDGDGLTDAEERAIGTDPARRDTDRDVLNDARETKVYGTDPLDADTDDDGLSDGKEVLRYGSDPLTADGNALVQTGEPGKDPTDRCVAPVAIGPFTPTYADRFEIRCGIEYS
jgi:hypothetical protein